MRDRLVINELEKVVRKCLCSWKDSNVLPTEAARELVEMILATACLHDVVGEFLSLPRHICKLGSGCEQIGS